MEDRKEPMVSIPLEEYYGLRRDSEMLRGLYSLDEMRNEVQLMRNDIASIFSRLHVIESSVTLDAKYM